MATLPGNIVDDIQWFEQRVASWAENAAAIGLTGEQTASITTETAEARSGYDAAQAAKTAAQNATVTQNTQVSEMRSLGGQLITAIRAFAELQPDPNVVYTLASVPPKQAASSVPPVTPTDIEYALSNTGSIEIKWKGTSAGGTVFSILRAVQPEANEPFGTFEQIGLTGSREFLDSTIPSCTVAAQYVIKAYKGAYPPASSTTATVRFTAGNEGEVGGIKLVA